MGTSLGGFRFLMQIECYAFDGGGHPGLLRLRGHARTRHGHTPLGPASSRGEALGAVFGSRDFALRGFGRDSDSDEKRAGFGFGRDPGGRRQIL